MVEGGEFLRKNANSQKNIGRRRPQNGPYPHFYIRRSGTIIDLFGVQEHSFEPAYIPTPYSMRLEPSTHGRPAGHGTSSRVLRES